MLMQKNHSGSWSLILINLMQVFSFRLTINDRVRSGMPVSFTQASITPWISAVIVDPDEKNNTYTQKNLKDCKH